MIAGALYFYRIFAKNGGKGFFPLPFREIRKAIEPVNFTIQKIIKRQQSFPNDEAAMKLIFMVIAIDS